MASKIEKKVEFVIHRFNPHNQKSYVSKYNVPVRKGMTVLEALRYIKDNFDETLAFRESCRMGICGSCGVIVNGNPVLACYTQVLHLESNSLVIEALPNLPIIKDLVVDIQPFFGTYKKVKPFLIKAEEELKKPEEFVQTKSDHKRYWDLTLCIKCSLCYSACPAIIDKKFLGPSTYATNYRFITDSRDDGLNERLKAMADNVWLCTSCHSCTLCCPKELQLSSSIVDSRSAMVETTGLIPRTGIDVLNSTVKYHNPLGVPPSKRTEWTKDLEIKEFPVPKAKILYFVCCSTAYDPRNQEIAKSMAIIFKESGVDFAILPGNEEWCCGDHQLRLGEKGLFQMLAEHNLSVFEKYEASRIVTLSPHCYNTFKNDEPYAGAKLDVQHYTQFVAEALELGSLKPSKVINKRVTYHDPCFLGKRNGIYDAPRNALESINGLEFVEMKRTKENSFCCGGGAGRVWTEDATPEYRLSVNRVKEALELGVEVLTTACPFCITTLEDAIKVLDAENKIDVKDISELLREAL